jgi:hypothetical protein
MASYPSLKYGTPPIVDPRYQKPFDWNGEEEDPLAIPPQAQYGPAGPAAPPLDMRNPVAEDTDPFSYDRLAARKSQPFQMTPKPPMKPPIGGWSSGPPQLGAALENAGPLPDMPQGPIQTPSGRPPTVGEEWIDPGEDPFLTDWNSAAAERDAHKRAKPLMGDKKYDKPLWQKLLMVGSNAAAGYVNAGRRTHIDPFSDKEIAARPKYTAAMDEWGTEEKALESRMGSLQQKYQLRRQADADQRANKLSKRQDIIADAQIEELNARAEQRRRPPVVKPTNPFMYTPGGALNTLTGKIQEGTEPPEKQQKIDAQQVILDPKSTPEQIEKAKDYLRMIHPPKQGGGGGAGGVMERFEATQRRLELQNQRKMQTDVDEIEYGVPGKPGLWQRRSKIGNEMSALDKNKPKPGTPESSDEYQKWLKTWKANADPDAAAEYDILTNELRNVTKKKLDNGWIDRDQYNKIMQGLAGGAPAGGGGAAATGGGGQQTTGKTTPGKMRKHLGAFDSQ